MEDIHFGTDGWRGIVGESFTFANVRRVGRALALLAKERKINDKPIVIGYDRRFMAEYFARAIYDELTSAGLKSELSDRPIPTPALSLATKRRHTAFGVMITASHNPYFYNGIKFKAAYGGPVMPEFTLALSRLLKKVKHTSNDAPVYAAKIPQRNLLVPYLRAIRRYVNFDVLKKARIKVAIDSMYGAGGKIFEELLADTGIRVVSIRTERNPFFDDRLPEPVPPFIEPLMQLACKEGCDIGLATDGDADRIGVVDSAGHFVTLHYIMPLLYEYLIKSRGMAGNAVRTASTDDLFDNVCEANGQRCIEVPVGFANVCRVALKEDILIGGEESGGICFKRHIPERDGILAGMLILEMLVAQGKTLANLVNTISRRFHPVEYLRTDRLFAREKLKANLASLRSQPPGKIDGSPVRRIDKRDGIKFYLANGCWMLMRVSDTEPKGRIYVGGRKISDVHRVLRAGERLLFRE